MLEEAAMVCVRLALFGNYRTIAISRLALTSCIRNSTHQ
jgi:hypothetical protein